MFAVALKKFIMKLLRAPSLLRFQCFVNAAWTPTPIDSITNPATGELLAHVPRFGEQETGEAIDAVSVELKFWSSVREVCGVGLTRADRLPEFAVHSIPDSVCRCAEIIASSNANGNG